MNIIRDVLIVAVICGWLASMPPIWSWAAKGDREAFLTAVTTASWAIRLSVILAVTQAMLSAGVVGAQ